MTKRQHLTTYDLDDRFLSVVAGETSAKVWISQVYQTVEHPIRVAAVQGRLIRRSMLTRERRNDHPNFGWDWYR